MNKSSVLATVLPAIMPLTASAQNASEAARDLSNIQSNDPQGFTWMLVCVGIIMTCAITLITVTTIFAMKGKKRT